MSQRRIRCQVIETPAGEDWTPRGQDWLPAGEDWPRDLLPWADPYIATLMVRLSRQYDWVGEPEADDPSTDPYSSAAAPVGFFPFGDSAAGNSPADDFPADDGWQDAHEAWQDADAFMPGWHEGPRRSYIPPVYGGFPLLDDVTDGLEEDPI